MKKQTKTFRYVYTQSLCIAAARVHDVFIKLLGGTPSASLFRLRITGRVEFHYGAAGTK